MNIDDIRDRFDIAANEYDEQRRRFIPCFDDYYYTSINFLAGFLDKPRSVLDLGAGTGLLSNCFMKYYPDARYVLADISESMLDGARKRFAGKGNVEYHVCDYSGKIPDGKYDIIASALSIHHLENDQKLSLYANLYKALEDGGCLINLDQFNAKSDKVNGFYNDWWYDYIRGGGIPKAEHDKWLKRRELDRENAIDDTLAMLEAAGFKTTECIYRFMKFGVVIGLK